MSSTQDSNLQQPSYEPYDPDTETQDTADAHILLVRLPDFTKQQVGAYHEVAHKRIRVFGEKPTENNKRIRFSKLYTIPEDCDANKLTGQFQEGAIITITIPKKPKEPEPEPTQEQETTKQVTAIPPQKPPSEVESEEVESEAADMKNGEKGVPEEKLKSEMEKPKEPEPGQEQEAAKQVTATPPQKSPSEVESKAADMKNGEKGVLEEKPKSELEKPKEPEPPQEQEAAKQVTATPPQKPPSEVESESKDMKNGEKGVPEEKCKLEMEKPKEPEPEPEPTQEQEAAKQVIATSPQKPASKVEFEAADMKNGEKGVPEEEPKSEMEKPKEPEPAQEQEAAKQVTATPPQTSKEGEKKHMGVQTNKVNEERSHENTVRSESSSTGQGMIKNMANSASEAVTRLANRFSEEDTQKKLLCAGAAILVVAVGIYASLKLRSMTRQ